MSGSRSLVSLPYFSCSLLLSRLELSDTKVYEPSIRARLGTTAHFCNPVVLKLRVSRTTVVSSYICLLLSLPILVTIPVQSLSGSVNGLSCADVSGQSAQTLLDNLRVGGSTDTVNPETINREP